METELGDWVIHTLTTVCVCEQNHSQRYKDMLQYMLRSSKKLDTLDHAFFCTPITCAKSELLNKVNSILRTLTQMGENKPEMNLER